MFRNVGSKLFGWLAMLALYPVVGLGQKILVHPQDQTVCGGETAVFTSETSGGFMGWFFNGMLYRDFPPEHIVDLDIEDMNTPDNTTIETVTVTYNQAFSGLAVQSLVARSGVPYKISNTAYLFYETNPQYPATGLFATTNKTSVQIQWDQLNSNFTTHFLVGIYDSANNPVLNTGFLTTNDTYYTHHLDQDSTCYDLEFRVTGVEIQYPHCNEAEQTTSTSIRVAYQDPNLNIGPVILELSERKVLVHWPSDNNSALIVITNLKNGNQTQIIYNGTSPYVHTEKACGHINLNVAVSPAQCAEPAFTRSASISFSIDCPTTATSTETETEITDQSSGTQANYPSLLLAIAAIIPLLKWHH